MPEISKAILAALESIKRIEEEMEKVGWQIYRVETDRSIANEDRIILFLSPIKKES